MNARARVAAITLFGLAACSGTSVSRREDPQLPALRAGGYRIAVMPFAVSAPDDDFLAASLAPVGQLLSLEVTAGNLPVRERLAAETRSTVVAWLQQGAFEVVEPWVTDTQVAHAGLAAAMQTPGRAAEVARILQVDGVLYGDVHRWNRSYYAVQTVVEAGLRLELIDGGSGRSLFSTERTESVGSGLTGGPTGFVSAATEPVAGLRASHLRELTRSVARAAVVDLNGGDLAGEVSPQAPRLHLIAPARTHDGPFVAGDRIDVIAVGTPDCDVRFDLGRLRTGVPMQQVAVQPDPRGDRATYAGYWIVQPGEQADGLPLLCTIRRQGERKVQASRYRWAGTIALGAVTSAAPAR